MTKTERRQLNRAIDLLCSDNGWDDGLKILAQLAGRSTERLEVLNKAKPVSPEKLAPGPDQSFQYREEA